MKAKEDEYVFYHSGSTPTYRKVTTDPTQTSPIVEIPTIDISAIDSPDISVREGLANELHRACVTCGFFYLKNHGLSEDLQRETFEIMKKFFALDLESKMDAHVQKNPAIRGYEPMFETKLDPRTKGGKRTLPSAGLPLRHLICFQNNLTNIPADLKESFTMGDCPLEPEQAYTLKTGQEPPAHLKRAQNIWPSSAPWFRDGLYRYYNQVLPISMKLVRLLALSFEIDEREFLERFFKFPITGMRPLHYPPAAPEAESGEQQSIGLGAHSDFSCRRPYPS